MAHTDERGSHPLLLEYEREKHKERVRKVIRGLGDVLSFAGSVALALMIMSRFSQPTKKDSLSIFAMVIQFFSLLIMGGCVMTSLKSQLIIRYLHKDYDIDYEDIGRVLVGCVKALFVGSLLLYMVERFAS